MSRYNRPPEPLLRDRLRSLESAMFEFRRVGGQVPDTPHLVAYNVMDFGAHGNGSDDDTAAIQAAIDTASADTGAVVLLPSSDHLISSTLTVPSGVLLRGVSMRYSRIVTDFNGTAISVTGDGVGLEALMVDTAGAFGGSANTGNGVDLVASGSVNPSWFHMSDVEIVANGVGLNIDGRSGATQPGDMFLTRCAIFRSGSSGNAVHIQDARHIYISQASTFTTGGAAKGSVAFDLDVENLHWHMGVVTGDLSMAGFDSSFVGVRSDGSFAWTLTADSNNVAVVACPRVVVTNNGTGNVVASNP